MFHVFYVIALSVANDRFDKTRGPFSPWDNTWATYDLILFASKHIPKTPCENEGYIET